MRRFFYFFQFGAGVGNNQPFVLQHDDMLFFKVVFVFDVADDFLEQVFNGNQPVNAAVFVNNHSHVDFVGLHVAQQVQDPHGRRNEFDLTVNDVFDFYVAFPFKQTFSQVDDMDDAQNVVKGIAVNRDAGVAAGYHQFGKFANRSVFMKGDNVGTGNHGVAAFFVFKVQNVI